MAGAGSALGIGVLAGKLTGDFNWFQGGKTFEQYKREYWSNRTKPKLDPMINWETGQTWEQFTELHHRFVPQRWKWELNERHGTSIFKAKP